MYVTQRPPTPKSTRAAVQGACYNHLATTLYMSAARQWGRRQHHACAVGCLRCIGVTSYPVLVHVLVFSLGPRKL